MKTGIGVAGCHAFQVVALIGMVMVLAACGGSKTGTGTVAESQPMSFEAVDASVRQYMACAIPAGRAKHLTGRDYASAAIRDAGFDALHRNAIEVAGARVDRFERGLTAASGEAGRAQADLEAIVSAADSAADVPEALRAKARAYEVYYQSLAVGSDCTLDQDVLKLINKGP